MYHLPLCWPLALENGNAKLGLGTEEGRELIWVNKIVAEESRLEQSGFFPYVTYHTGINSKLVRCTTTQLQAGLIGYYYV